MAGIERFEDIEAWKKARVLTGNIYRMTSQSHFARDYGLKDQIRRASISVMSNIAEGFERSGNKEFSYFLSIAKGSVGEVRAQLYIALDANLITQDQFAETKKMAEDISRMISGLIRYLKTNSSNK